MPAMATGYLNHDLRRSARAKKQRARKDCGPDSWFHMQRPSYGSMRATEAMRFRCAGLESAWLGLNKEHPGLEGPERADLASSFSLVCTLGPRPQSPLQSDMYIATRCLQTRGNAVGPSRTSSMAHL